MSRGFVREEDQEEIPMVPQRAFLPEGVANFVTPEGMDELLAEKQTLMKEKENTDFTSENETRIALNFINARLKLLDERIAGARIIDPKDQPALEIRFGATVTLKSSESDQTQRFKIVGVDEADISKGKISFISPLARQLINKKAGETIHLKTDMKDVFYEITDIAYS
ncbi:MAG: GreA/GreB family elongation factor [Bacteroidales bacterium]|jgi:transcription elongation factor GreB|nr:GreA/GreB family elongation factor [Bacteroidales bacterium]